MSIGSYSYRGHSYINVVATVRNDDGSTKKLKLKALKEHNELATLLLLKSERTWVLDFFDLIKSKSVRHWTKTTLREKVIRIGAKVICHARYIVLQMAEVAVSRELFAAILGRIRRLRILLESNG
ncbi:MAG: transposase [Spirochaetia bacterium]